MPADMFQPMAGVQTSIYIFEAHKTHDFESTVKFIDFRNDGYKRTKRALKEIDEPAKRYSDIIRVNKAGESAKVEANWDIDKFILRFYHQICSRLEFRPAQKIDTKPTLNDFRTTVANFLVNEVEQILKKVKRWEVNCHSIQSRRKQLEKICLISSQFHSNPKAYVFKFLASGDFDKNKVEEITVMLPH
ncbi:hypothetical protein [Vibrio cyclitrophicus]|uniref:hypothetical protein n=1 Tax=Vibrio cyclitrophicus TaxID=47951 RepID=UPI00399C441B